MSSSSPAAGEPPAPSASTIVAETEVGSHVLTIQGYSRTKGLGNGKFMASANFTAGGHRWYIRYYPDGNGAASKSWISIFLSYLKDEAPDDAAQVVKAHFTLSLLDEAGEPVPLFSDVKCTFSAATPSWGFRKFMERKALEESPYMKDDSFRLRCDVTIRKDYIYSVATAPPPLVDVPPSDMGEHLGRLLDAGKGVDVTFEVAGEAFAAHRCVLAARSPVFMAELFGPMEEKTASSIRIHDMEAPVFKAMLGFIYTDSLPAAIDDDGDTVSMVQHLLVAADRYGLVKLKLLCEDKLCRSVDASTVATTLALAEQHGCPGLKKACFELLKSPRHLAAAMATEAFDHLMSSCPALIKELLLMAKFAAPCP